MRRILDITSKDLLQLLRERNTFLFLLFMPMVFTLMLGFASGGFSAGQRDARIPVGYLDLENTWLTRRLHDELAASEVIRLDESWKTQADLEAQVSGEKLPAAIVIPSGYSRAFLDGKQAKILLLADTGSTTGTTIKGEVLSKIIRLENAVRTAVVMERIAGSQVPFDFVFDKAFTAWQDPPIRVEETTSTAIKKQESRTQSLAQTSPAMMLQFAIAGLLTCAQVIVSERKSHALQRLLTTATRRSHILMGHFLAIFALIFCQFLLLIGFGQVFLRLDYLAQPGGVLLVAAGSAFCVAGLGLLIGIVAKTEEQAVIFSLVPMFILAGLGGAWVPLEATGPAFQTFGHFSPIAWGMDGFKNLLIRGLGWQSAILPATVLFGYGVVFIVLAFWRFRTE